MNKTLEYYSSHAEEYIKTTMNYDMKEVIDDFLFEVGRRGSSILDVGFGSGRDSLEFKKRGYKVTSLDPVKEFYDHGLEIGLDDVVCNSIVNYRTKKRFKGIWACASLHHLKRGEYEKAIARCYTLLKKGGVLYLSQKITKKKDKNGRYFLPMKTGELAYILYKTGFVGGVIWESGDAQGRADKWVNAIVYKPFEKIPFDEQSFIFEEAE